jgi:enoyl-CoA hydratase
MKLETVLYEKNNNIGVLRLYRPERMNAVIEQMYIDINTILDKVETDSEVKVLIFTGCVWKRDKGDKQAFCAGADLKKHSEGDRTPFEKREYIFLAHNTTKRIYEFPKPVIAAVNGPARGAGTEMALNCDFLIMADNATIGFPETSLGTFVGGGVTYHITNLLPIQKAKELIYSGKILNGKEAVEYGLAYKSYPIEFFMENVLKFAEGLAEKAPLSMRFAKKLIQKAPHLDIDTVITLEAEAILACMTTEDWHEGIKAFMEKRKPVYKGK